jgi:hypothetical protein
VESTSLGNGKEGIGDRIGFDFGSGQIQQKESYIEYKTTNPINIRGESLIRNKQAGRSTLTELAA